MKLGVITDEVSQDFRVAADFARRHQMAGLELRTVNNVGLFEITDSFARELRNIADGYGLAIPALSSPVFKCNFDDTEACRKHVEGFRHCLDLAGILGAGMIRIFDFWASSQAALEARRDALSSLAEMAKPYGVVLVLENDPAVHSNTFAKIAQTVQAVRHPHLKALFDPGNALYTPHCEPPFPEGYKAVKSLFAHVHIKDAAQINGQTVSRSVGEGSVDYKGLLKQLRLDGYDGYLMLETHHRITGSIPEELLKLPGGASFSEGGLVASEISACNLTKLMQEVEI